MPSETARGGARVAQRNGKQAQGRRPRRDRHGRSALRLAARRAPVVRGHGGRRQRRARPASRTPTRSPAGGRSRTPVPAAAAKLTVGDASRTSRGSPTRSTSCSAPSTWTKAATAKLEEDYARAETPVVSNNSAHRWTPDVPMMIPEINADHMARHRGAAQAARHQARLHRGQAELLDPELRPGDPSAVVVRADARSRCARTRRSRAPARRSRPGPRWSTT